ncbi:outer membrane protein assembly factor BamE [Caenimonas sedimenti]|uniref:Outer membrane protein assembly factor BamE n=1 Tax=Caenimonas sedimenti TaxID=2596921 RepID=A0A562ZE48_9BURK|nr:outer membrane protein assembly factor BamE [Caenimonas sedimenti]
MHFPPDRTPRIALAAAAALVLAGCGSFNMKERVTGLFSPYKIEIVQGNFVSREQVEALKPGMSRQQVRDILGTPLVTSLFHADRWDYVFTLKRQGVEPQQRKLTVFFKGDAMDRAQGDTMPSEAEFVATLDNKRKTGAIPPMEASEDKLREFSGKSGAASTPMPATPPTAPAASYPPLEPPAR